MGAIEELQQAVGTVAEKAGPSVVGIGGGWGQGSGVVVAEGKVLTNHCDYQDLGGDYFVKRDAERQRDRAVNELMRLGYKVTLEEAYAA